MSEQDKGASATCIIPNCRRRAPTSEPFCSRHRDSRSKPDRAETTQIGSVHESGGAEGNRQESVASQPGEYQRGIEAAAIHLERRADEFGDSVTAQSMAAIFREEATTIRQLKDTP